MPSIFDRTRTWARELKTNLVAVYLAGRDPRTPLFAKIVAVAVAAYALSPIDLIPDFIPVLGHLDDLLIVPLGLFWAIRLIPAEIWDEHCKAAAAAGHLPRSWWAGAAIFALWMVGAIALAAWWYRTVLPA